MIPSNFRHWFFSLLTIKKYTKILESFRKLYFDFFSGIRRYLAGFVPNAKFNKNWCFIGKRIASLQFPTQINEITNLLFVKFWTSNLHRQIEWKNIDRMARLDIVLTVLRRNFHIFDDLYAWFSQTIRNIHFFCWNGSWNAHWCHNAK